VDARDLWAAMFRDAQGLLEIRVIWPRPRPTDRTFVPLSGLLARQQAWGFAVRHQDAACVGFGLQPRRRMRGKADDVLSVVTFAADFDDDKTPGGRGGALDRIHAFPLPFSALVDSGHGLHAYWLLNRPVPIQAQADRSRCEAAARRLVTHLRADATWDLARVLRVPGTLNSKGAPVRSRLLELAPDVRYDLPQFEAVLPAQQRLTVQRSRPTRREGSLSPRVERLIRGGNDGMYPSRSEADFAVVCALVRAGYSDGEIIDVFASHPDGIGQKFLERGERYLSRTITAARRVAIAS